MPVTVVADEKGEIVAALVHRADRAPEPEKDPEGMRFVTGEGETAVTVDTPEELVGREPGNEYFESLRRYVVREGKLVTRSSG
jgi:hypothetical protein